MAKKKIKQEEKETKIDKEIKKYLPLLAGLGILILIFIVFYFAFSGLGKVKYEGLTFVKERYGEIEVYHYSYLTKLDNGNIRAIDVIVRGNPAENSVPIDSKIVYPEGKSVYLSINNSGLNKCEDSIIAIAELSGFLANNEIPLKAGTPDREEARKNNSTYITCESYPNNLIISLREGSETKITRTGSRCYNMEVANCEIVPAMEKFIIRSIVDAKG